MNHEPDDKNNEHDEIEEQYLPVNETRDDYKIPLNNAPGDGTLYGGPVSFTVVVDCATGYLLSVYISIENSAAAHDQEGSK